MRVLIFGGTTEGRELSRALARRGAAVTVSVATAYGAEEQGDFPGVRVLTGRKSAEEMEALMADAELCVDATHPYAAEVSANIRAAAARTGTPCKRLLRPESETEGLLAAEDAAAAAALLADTEGNVLLTTGSKELAAYAALGPERLFPRVLPARESIEACEAAGIPRRNIIAMQGPFSQELNEAILRQYRIAWMVSKDGGAAGGFPEKAAAARALGVRLIVLRRPEDAGADLATILKECEELICK